MLLRVTFTDPDWTADDLERLARSVAPRLLTFDGALAGAMANALRQRGVANIRFAGEIESVVIEGVVTA